MVKHTQNSISKSIINSKKLKINNKKLKSVLLKTRYTINSEIN